MLEQELKSLKKEVIDYADLMMRSDLISDRQLYGINVSLDIAGEPKLAINACVAALEALNQIYNNMAVAYKKKKRGSRIISLQ